MSSGVERAGGFLPPIGNGAEPFFGTAAEFDLSIQQVRAGQGVRYAFNDAPSTETPGKVMPDTPPGNAGSGGPNLLRGLQRLGPLLGIGAAGYALGDKAGQWYHGQEVSIAKRIGDRVGGQVSMFSEQAYVIGTHLGFPSIGGQAQIDYANGLLSLKAGRPTDFRTMEPNTLADLIEAPCAHVHESGQRFHQSGHRGGVVAACALRMPCSLSRGMACMTDV